METLERTPHVEYGPLLEEVGLSGGLDQYKLTMSQFQYENEPDADVTFTFKNRGEQRLADYIDPRSLQDRFDTMRIVGWSDQELAYFRSIKTPSGEPLLTDDYVDYLQNNELPEISVTTDPETQDIAIETTGKWPMVTFWETIVMSEVNEAYFEGFVRAHDLDIFDMYDEGAKRLQEKIDRLQENPDVKFVNFGTRRHFSLRWHRYVDEQLMNGCPNNFIGTSNLATARELGLTPSGTFAHEMPMVYCGLADERGEDIRATHGTFLDQWVDRYPDYDVALTDTYTTDFFFDDFTTEQAQTYRKLRQDSGDPYEFGLKALAYYEAQGIDPRTKTIVFSDGLDIDQIFALHDFFDGHINVVFGWGTTLTNDLGVKPLNIVMKATEVNGVKTVKLSDNAGKNTGPQTLVTRYQETFKPTEEEDERITAACYA